jgi:hypothetical protein
MRTLYGGRFTEFTTSRSSIRKVPGKENMMGTAGPLRFTDLFGKGKSTGKPDPSTRAGEEVKRRLNSKKMVLPFNSSTGKWGKE